MALRRLVFLRLAGVSLRAMHAARAIPFTPPVTRLSVDWSLDTLRFVPDFVPTDVAAGNAGPETQLRGRGPIALEAFVGLPWPLF
jgi:hypothetical protein